MKTRIITAIFLISLTLLALFQFPFYLFLLLIDLTLLLGFMEMKKIMEKSELPLFRISLVFVLVFPWAWNYTPDIIPSILIAALVLHLIWALASPLSDLKFFLPATSASFFTVIYLGIPFSILSTYQVNSPQSVENSGRIWELMLIFVALWLSDSAAYFTGRVIGRHKITPRISPNKSLEGFIAGIIFPAAGAIIYGKFLLPDYSVWFLLSAGIILGISGIMGDLFESALKRGSGIKDSSNLFPGHGGILDRTDSLLAGVPAFYLLQLIWENFQ
jgi:phosphatidate cytidylyltransferase